MRFGEPEALRVALGGETVDMRAAGVGEAHHFCALVESFAGGVVDCLAEDFHVLVAAHEHYLRIASRDEEAQEGKVWHAIVGMTLDEMAKYMAVEMIDRYDGLSQTQRQTFGERCTYEQRA